MQSGPFEVADATNLTVIGNNYKISGRGSLSYGGHAKRYCREDTNEGLEPKIGFPYSYFKSGKRSKD